MFAIFIWKFLIFIFISWKKGATNHPLRRLPSHSESNQDRYRTGSQILRHLTILEMFPNEAHQCIRRKQDFQEDQVKLECQPQPPKLPHRWLRVKEISIIGSSGYRNATVFIWTPERPLLLSEGGAGRLEWPQSQTCMPSSPHSRFSGRAAGRPQRGRATGRTAHCQTIAQICSSLRLPSGSFFKYSVLFCHCRFLRIGPPDLSESANLSLGVND